MKTIIISTNWDKKQKSGGWGASCEGRTISGQLEATTTDKLVLTAMIEAAKEFGNCDSVKFVTLNTRAIHAVRHPSSSVNCSLARQFRATAKANRTRYQFI